METKARVGAIIEAQVERSVIYQPRFLVKSIWDIEHWRKGQMLSKTQDHNICTDEGLDALLDIMFGATAKIATWYIAIFESDTTPSAATTYAVPVYTESTAYTEAARQEYTDVPASSKVMTNSAAKGTFTMNATKTIYGAALVGGGSDPTVNTDTAGGGTLYCASQFGASKAVVTTDVLKVTVTITAADV